MNNVVDDSDERILAALSVAVSIGGFDGAHHKAFAIDQMVRCLTGCPTVQVTAKDSQGEEYTYGVLGESDEYKMLVADARAGEDGPGTYDWDVGIPP